MSKRELFQVNVTVLEARHLRKINVNTVIEVSIGRHTKKISPKTKKTDNPHFNEKCQFRFKIKLEELLEKRIRLAAYMTNYLKLGKKLMGATNIELAAVWSKPYHQFYHKWAVLTKPNDPFSAVEGYLKCDIHIIGRDVSAQIPVGEIGSQIEGNLMTLGTGLERQKAFFCINIYRADGIKLDFEKDTPKNMFIRANFANITLQTKEAKNQSKPVWNESLTFPESLPCLFETITIELWDKKQKTLIGATKMSLNDLSNQNRLGCLPTLGPSFIYLYKRHNKHFCQCSYGGRLLVSFTTKLMDRTNSKKLLNSRSIAPMDESKFPKYEQFTLFFTIFQVVFFQKELSGKSFVINLRHGANFTQNTQFKVEENHAARDSGFTSLKYQPKENLDELKCVNIALNWPTFHEKELKQNQIKSIFRRNLEQIYEFEKCINIGVDRCRNLLCDIKASSNEVLAIPPFVYMTNLETANRASLNEDTIKLKEDILFLEKNISFSDENFTFLKNSIENILRYCEDLTPTFPHIELSITAANKRVDLKNYLKAADFLYSSTESQKGKLCGRVKSHWMRDPVGEEIAAIDALSWFGKTIDFDDCVKHLPKEQDLRGSYLNTTKLVPNKMHMFQLRVYIYQGRINQDVDASGPISPYFRAITHGSSLETQVKYQTMDPIWDETLVFHKLSINADSSFIHEASIAVYFELVDYSSSGVIGRGVYRPLPKLKEFMHTQPRLQWTKFYKSNYSKGEVLLAMELIEISDYTENNENYKDKLYSIPNEIKPHFECFYIEVLFWGLRNITEVAHLTRAGAMVVLQSNQVKISSNIIKLESSTNFDGNIHLVEVLLPKELDYAPPLTITLYEVNLLKKVTYKGSCIVPSIDKYLVNSSFRQPERKSMADEVVGYINAALKHIDLGNNCKQNDPEPNSDWWTKYYASKENLDECHKIKIYGNELEKQPQFNQFQDILNHFKITKGKPDLCCGTGSVQVDVGLLKASIRLHKVPSADFKMTQGSLFSLPKNEPIDIVVRVYVIAAFNLYATDINGRCDPYISISLGDQKISDRKNYIYKDINPIFGKFFELQGKFPKDNNLTIRIMDHDVCSSDDLIGMTTIDIENRFYTIHYASCGISDTYEKDGYCQWRDILSPSEILIQLCQQSQLPQPIFAENYLDIGEFRVSRNGDDNDELALRLLKSFSKLPKYGFEIVPEHIETRSLHHPKKPYLETGKLEMWIDIFPASQRLPSPIEITPRIPLKMELRVIIWKAIGVTLADYNFLTGSKSSDIYIKAWLTNQRESQKTDVHEKSQTGEGIFNWRFIFPFQYSTMEKKMIVTREVSFSEKSWPEKLPCILEIQVWDQDLLEDDFIGSLSLKIDDLPVGSKFAKLCNMKVLNEKRERLNLFESKRYRGWWPLRSNSKDKDGNCKQAGKIDLELELLLQDEAKMAPAGIGRNGPQALPQPVRPKNVPFWKLNFFKFIKLALFGKLGKQVIVLISIAMAGLFVLAGIYSLPSILLTKWIGEIGS